MKCTSSTIDLGLAIPYLVAVALQFVVDGLASALRLSAAGSSSSSSTSESSTSACTIWNTVVTSQRLLGASPPKYLWRRQITHTHTHTHSYTSQSASLVSRDPAVPCALTRGRSYLMKRMVPLSRSTMFSTLEAGVTLSKGPSSPSPP